jgi:hypothetical protein
MIQCFSSFVTAARGTCLVEGYLVKIIWRKEIPDIQNAGYNNKLNFDRFKRFCASVFLPQTEMDLNGALVQNPGY